VCHLFMFCDVVNLKKMWSLFGFMVMVIVFGFCVLCGMGCCYC
jgi:hypothetical protein